jgi:hypothetical protein
MQTVAQTTNGPVSNYFWLNSREEKTSKLIHTGHLEEVLGMSTEEVDQYEDLESLNNEVSDGSFTVSDEAEFPIINAEGKKEIGIYLLPDGRGNRIYFTYEVDFDTRSYDFPSSEGNNRGDLISDLSLASGEEYSEDDIIALLDEWLKEQEPDADDIMAVLDSLTDTAADFDELFPNRWTLNYHEDDEDEDDEDEDEDDNGDKFFSNPNNKGHWRYNKSKDTFHFQLDEDAPGEWSDLDGIDRDIIIGKLLELGAI